MKGCRVSLDMPHEKETFWGDPRVSSGEEIQSQDRLLIPNWNPGRLSRSVTGIDSEQYWSGGFLAANNSS